MKARALSFSQFFRRPICDVTNVADSVSIDRGKCSVRIATPEVTPETSMHDLDRANECFNRFVAASNQAEQALKELLAILATQQTSASHIRPPAASSRLPTARAEQAGRAWPALVIRQTEA
ncbi:MAG: hypothetical protein ABI051_13985 [Vicinamibacterales bacterium]